MSTPTEGEAPPRRPTAPTGGGGGNVFTRKLGPAPLWVWMLAGLGIALAISAIRGNRQKAAQAANAQPSAAGTGAGAGPSQVPPFIIQNFPGSGVPGPQGPAGATGPAGPTGAAGAPGAPAAPPVVPPAVPTPPQGTPPPPSAPREPLEYRVKPGDTLSSIAQRYGTSAQRLWQYNTSAEGGRPQSTINTLLQRGPNLLYSNELILIPQ